MPKFSVELSRTDYYVIEVEADDEDDAREQALEDICQQEEPVIDHCDGFEVCGCTEVST